MASFQVDPARIEELAWRLGKEGRTGAHQVGSYTVFPLLTAEPCDASFFLGSKDAPPSLAPPLSAIFAATALIVSRKVRDAEQQRARREGLSRAQSSRREMEHRDASVVRVRHDLKAPLVSMRGYLDMLLRGMAGPLSSQTQRYLQRLSQSVEHQRALIDSELSAGPDGLTLVDVDHLLRIVLERAAACAASRGIGFAIDAWRTPIWVRADRTGLELLFRLLVRIATRQARSGSRVEARLRSNDESVAAELRSDVPWQPRVVEFRICQEIVRRHKGQLFVSEGRDVLVQVRLPQERDLDRWLQGAPRPVSPKVLRELRGRPATG
ncbi:MAG TPA: HAMP domain-containing sensor histidine kinase [Myxococcaceae bacterium]|nr:HAMP domain-containing sensor histidine kinase [Myxococcaceae bacterium]